MLVRGATEIVISIEMCKLIWYWNPFLNVVNSKYAVRLHSDTVYTTVFGVYPLLAKNYQWLFSHTKAKHFCFLITHLPGVFMFLDLFLGHSIGLVPTWWLCGKFTFSIRIFYGVGQGFATDWPCGVQCLTLSTCSILPCISHLIFLLF